jgi:hypothetical protein
MAGWTNRGKARCLGGWFRNNSVPTVFYMALVTSAVAPTADTNTFTELTEIANGNGYTTGGYSLSRNATDFDTGPTEVDASDYAYIQIKDIIWTASSGNLPGSGSGARYAVLLDDNATIADRDVLAFFDLTSDRTVSDTQTLTLQNCELRLTE